MVHADKKKGIFGKRISWILRHPLPQKLFSLWPQIVTGVNVKQCCQKWNFPSGSTAEWFHWSVSSLPAPPHPGFFFVSSPIWILPAYQKAAAFQPKKSHMHKTKYFKVSQNNQGHPSLQQTPKWDELQVWCGSDALTCVRWAQITLLAFTGVVNCHRTLAQGKGKHRNWNKACSQSAAGSQPLFYSEVLKLVKLIHHKLCVYKVKCPGKWDCSANNAVLDGAVKGHNSQWDDYVSQLLRWITKFTFQYLVILGGFSLGMKLLTETYFS